MQIDFFHFAQPIWFLGLMAIPLVCIGYLFSSFVPPFSKQLEKFADPHLIPFLLINSAEKKRVSWKILFLWSLIWSLLITALAEPRWSFREMESFSRGQNLLILLDLSESMNAKDVKPSRLTRAKQKIEDIINQSRGIKVGLIAYAADAHMITPLTDDKETLLHILPSLNTDIVYVQGSRLEPALKLAMSMVDGSLSHSRSLLIISDGGFEDSASLSEVQRISDKGVAVYTMGVGTVEGAPLQDSNGNLIRKQGTEVISKLEMEKLKEIAKIGKGTYIDADYSDEGIGKLLRDLEERSEAKLEKGRISRQWDEEFYWFLFPVLPFLLWRIRRGTVIALLPLFFMLTCPLQADLFKNREERGQEALNAGEYEKAIELFEDSYRKGVASYRAGKFKEAETLFKKCSRQEVISFADYNLGNALFQQQKFEEAKAAYEKVLQQSPDHKHAEENLELVKKILEQQKKQQSKNDNQKNKQQQKQDNNQSKEKQKQNKENDDLENQEKQEQEKHDQQAQNQEKQERQKNENSEQRSQEQDLDNQENLNEEQQKKEKNQPDNSQEKTEKGEKEHKPIDNASLKSKEKDEQKSASEKEEKIAVKQRSQEDLDADLWLNQIEQDTSQFMKNKFYIESKNKGTQKGSDPW